MAEGRESLQRCNRGQIFLAWHWGDKGLIGTGNLNERLALSLIRKEK